MKKIEKPYEFFEATADVGLYGYGYSLNEAFENSALAMFNVITSTDNIKAIKEFDFTIESEDEVSLLYDFLEELLFIHEVEFVLLSNFNVNIEECEDSYTLKAQVKGEDINWDIHERGCEVKAITFHKMDVKKEENIYITSAILDL